VRTIDSCASHGFPDKALIHQTGIGEKRPRVGINFVTAAYHKPNPPPWTVPFHGAP